ncbi:hypothetical protein B0H11DRAFT_1914729 [Mycena galericulata]|nr:hypothetical protein B0H11DRAFT_1914729 [Mycena galericulata]
MVPTATFWHEGLSKERSFNYRVTWLETSVDVASVRFKHSLEGLNTSALSVAVGNSEDVLEILIDSQEYPLCHRSEPTISAADGEERFGNRSADRSHCQIGLRVMAISMPVAAGGWDSQPKLLSELKEMGFINTGLSPGLQTGIKIPKSRALRAKCTAVDRKSSMPASGALDIKVRLILQGGENLNLANLSWDGKPANYILDWDQTAGPSASRRKSGIPMPSLPSNSIVIASAISDLCSLPPPGLRLALDLLTYQSSNNNWCSLSGAGAGALNPVAPVKNTHFTQLHGTSRELRRPVAAQR